MVSLQRQHSTFEIHNLTDLFVSYVNMSIRPSVHFEAHVSDRSHVVVYGSAVPFKVDDSVVVVQTGNSFISADDLSLCTCSHFVILYADGSRVEVFRSGPERKNHE